METAFKLTESLGRHKFLILREPELYMVIMYPVIWLNITTDISVTIFLERLARKSAD